MSTINDLIQLADTLQRRKVEDRRYQDQRNMQIAQIAEVKNKENQVIQGQRFFNDMTAGLMKSGWDDEGKWTGEAPDTNKLVETYLGNMDSLGLAGDSALALQRVSQFNQLRLKKAGAQLQSKFANWSANNPDAKPEDKAEYLSSINADKLYSQLYGLGGPVAATELTGISPDVFVAKNETPYLKIGGGVIGSAVIAKYGGPKALNAVRGLFKSVAQGKKIAPEKVRQLLPSVEALAETNPEAAQIMDKIIKAQRGGDTKKAIKILNRFQKRFPELNVLDEIVKGAPIKGTKPSSILRKMKKLLPFSAPLVGAGIDEAMGMEAPVAETAGTVIMGAAQKKPFLQFLGSKLPARVAPKALALAAADGPLPWGELLALGLTGAEVIRLFREWTDLSNQ